MRRNTQCQHNGAKFIRYSSQLDNVHAEADPSAHTNNLPHVHSNLDVHAPFEILLQVEKLNCPSASKCRLPTDQIGVEEEEAEAHGRTYLGVSNTNVGTRIFIGRLMGL